MKMERRISFIADTAIILSVAITLLLFGFIMGVLYENNRAVDKMLSQVKIKEHR